MQFQRQLTRQDFALWIRTGRVPAPVEYKFNGWHDPDDGRFTHAGAGRYFPGGSSSMRAEQLAMAPLTRNPISKRQGRDFTGRHGGSFGGGGASGPGWETPDEQNAREHRLGNRPVVSGGLQPASAKIAASARGQSQYTVKKGETLSSIAAREKMTVDQLVSINSISDPNKIITGQALTIPAIMSVKPGWVSVRVDRLSFELDSSGRTGVIDGILGVKATKRSERMQANAGKPDRQAGDDGGHFIASRFGGPKAAYNHFAQEANFNRGVYRALEGEWARTQREGHDVRVRIDVRYSSDRRRPDALQVQWVVGGRHKERNFKNQRGGADDNS